MKNANFWFQIRGLWCARQYGVPPEKSFTRATILWDETHHTQDKLLEKAEVLEHEITEKIMAKVRNNIIVWMECHHLCPTFLLYMLNI